MTQTQNVIATQRSTGADPTALQSAAKTAPSRIDHGPVDAARSEAFAQKMMQHLNSAAITLILSIGHRTGLLDAMAQLGPSTSDEIAQAASLSERYVREALGVLATGGVVEYDGQSKRYVLPREHAAWLTRAASPSNMAVSTQWIGVLAGVEDQVVECFRRGGGVPYEQYKRFHEVMAEESRQTVVQPLLDVLVPMLPGLADRLERGADVLDIGCGSGEALERLARRYPKSRFTGYDLSPEAVDRGRARMRAAGLKNVTLECRNAAEPFGRERYDWITTFDAIHDQAAPDAVLRHIHAALKYDGWYLMQEISGSSHVHEDAHHPIAPFLYAVSCMHCMSVSLSQGGKGLGAMWGRETAQRMLQDAGFRQVEIRSLPHDIINDYYLVQK